jgi:drug/metabolite transporter (DMT)-like permease
MTPHLYAIGIFLFVALMNACVKGLDNSVPMTLILACRLVTGVLIFTPMILKRGGFRKVLKTDHPYKQILRAFLSMIGIACGFYAVPLLPLGDANALWQSYGFFVLLLSVPILGERIDLKYYLICAIGFVGVLLISQPHGDGNILPVALVLISAFIAAITTLTVRLMARKDQDITILAWFFCLASIISVGWYLAFTEKEALTIEQCLLLAGAGIFGSFSQYFMVQAFKFLRADVVGSYAYSGIVFSLVIGFICFDEIPTPWMLAGAALILSGIHFSYQLNRKMKPVVPG